MREHIISKLRRHWLGAATVSLILPVVLPSNSYYFFQNIIGMSTAFLFLISFPTSLLLGPISVFEEIVFGPRYFSIGGMFGNLVILFALGAFQWFWLIPKILRTQQEFRRSQAFGSSSDPSVLNAEPMSSVSSRDESPLQILINADEQI